MGNKNISEAIAAKVEAFKDFITDGTTPDDLRKTLINVYFNYTRLINRSAESVPDKELFYLSEIIEILDDAEA